MRIIDLLTTPKTLLPCRRLVDHAVRCSSLPPGTRVRVRLRRPVEVAQGRGVAFVPYFAETVYT